MPKNKGKGGKNRRRGKNENDAQKRELELADEEQKYAQVEKATGSGRLEIQVFHRDENTNAWVKETKIGLIRGSLRKKVWIGTGDIVLVAERDYQEDKLDVVHKYFPEEVQELKSRTLLPPDAGITARDGVEDSARGNELLTDAQAAWEFGAVDQDDENENATGADKLVIDDI